jgi:hypothetical protein
MKSPRIYTYKVTFEEVPHWYWGVHKERFYLDGYLGSPVTHKWMWEFYTPNLQVLEIFPNTDEGWNEAIKVEKRLIMLDLHNPLCLNEACGAFYSLDTLRLAASLGGKAAALSKNEEGKSAISVRAASVTHSVKDADGKSVAAKKAGNRTKELGVGICSPETRSAAGRAGGKVTASQVWESTIDGYRGSAGSIALRHKARGWDLNARIRLS